MTQDDGITWGLIGTISALLAAVVLLLYMGASNKEGRALEQFKIQIQVERRSYELF